ncbi:cell division protein ZapA [Alicyclobacillus tolerans]|uniref:Cell division protein ZapA n=2 Tax=Alicyclobacillus tolerans TaxID=90970 RepID=A0ABT9LSK8_9BACL|nr:MULTISPECIES: cell division protein ZapA [Alicyclobacillus]MDP9727245.1 cell division protein ZapA [Alicyclobacillus tengchongensis]SHJ56834.1 cell division protein ZapA [Alicyclobacillus montanus]
MEDAHHNRVKVEIFGTEYTLRGDASSQHMRQVAQRVDRLMAAISSAIPHLDERRVAVLSAVNMADELIQTENKLEQLQAQYEKLEKEHRELLELLDEQTRQSN